MTLPFGNSNSQFFSNLDLSDVEASQYRPLQPGRYIFKTSKAEERHKDGKVSISVRLDSIEGKGGLVVFFNIVHPSADHQRIERERLKTMLVYGEHPNPDRPGSLDSLNGLLVGAYVDHETFQDKTNLRVKYFFDPAEGEGDSDKATSGAPAGAGKLEDDDVPF